MGPSVLTVLLSQENRNLDQSHRTLKSLCTAPSDHALLNHQFGQNTFRGEGLPPDPFYERGCRRTLTLDNHDGTSSPSSSSYVVDALEMPSRHLSSNPLLEQAVAITEAAVLVYDVRDRDSLRLAVGVAEYVREITTGVGTMSATAAALNGCVATPRRDYGLLLVGNKCDGAVSERTVSWAEGRKAALVLAAMGRHGRGAEVVPTVRDATTASTGGSGCAFLEVSAKTGDNVDKIFAVAGREVLKSRWLNQQRREEAERMLKLRQGQETPGLETFKKRRLGFWRSLRRGSIRR
jgi:GTPase SAR1 family protein